jgi:Uncharacterized protein conserved in bacteria
VAANKHLQRAERALRDHALRYPETTEEFPWEHRAIKVKGKIFLFLFRDQNELSLSVKLPDSNRAAVALPFAAPSGYGLGRSGWVTARFAGDAEPPVEMLTDWVDESYRAIAPKRVLAMLIKSRLNGPKPQSTARSSKRPLRAGKTKQGSSRQPQRSR